MSQSLCCSLHNQHNQMYRLMKRRKMTKWSDLLSLEFNPDEDNVEDHVRISGKQYMILNYKINSIIQFLNDSAGKSNVNGEEVKFLLKSQEPRTRTLIDDVVRVWMNVWLFILEPSIMKSRNYKILLVSKMNYLKS